MQVFQTLLENAGFLTDDAKKELTEAMDQVVAEARQEAIDAVTVELHEQWAADRDLLVEALDAQVQDLFKEHLTELRESVDAFYDLEADYAIKLVEAKAELETNLQEQFNANREELIDSLDTFLEVALAEEVESLREGIEEARKNRLGQRIMEAFLQEYREFYVTDDSVEAQLAEAKAQIEDLSAELDDKENELEQKDRKIKMDEALSPLTGKSRELMSALLENVQTKDIGSTYERFIGRVLNESTEKTGSAQLNEDNKTKTPSGIVKDGSTAQTLIQEQLEKGNFKQLNEGSVDGIAYWRKLGGV